MNVARSPVVCCFCVNCAGAHRVVPTVSMSTGEPAPAHVRPMLATLGPLPTPDDSYAVELKWDGIRAVAHWDGVALRLESRSLRDVTVAFPELAPLGGSLGAGPTVLDGEVVALDDRGVPSFERLQERMHVGDARIAARKAEEVPVAYFVFDVLHLGGRSLLGLPWDDRRRLLEDLGLSGTSWATPPAFLGAGPETMAVARARDLEGVVAKRRDSAYVPGARSRAWIKVKVLTTESFVVGGFLPGEGGRAGRIGALLLGEWRGGADSGEGDLDYVGAVGTGFTAAELARLGARLVPLERSTSPFRIAVPRSRNATWLEPEAVVEVEYRERTGARILRHPSYKGERIDKTPADVNTGDGS